jgi:hypothetical protein
MLLKKAGSGRFPSPVEVETSSVEIGVVNIFTGSLGFLPVNGQIHAFCTIWEYFSVALLFLGYHKITKAKGHFRSLAGVKHMVSEGVIKGIDDLCP